MEEIRNNIEYKEILEEIQKNNYSEKEILELWNAIDDSNSTYGNYSEWDIARAIVYLISKIKSK